MKKISNYVIVLLVLISCTNQQTEIKGNSVDVQETNQDFLKIKRLENRLKSKINEPFQVSEIDKLEFTSGGGEKIEEHKKCDSSNTGFYGSYSLIDPNYADEIGRPIGGTIIIHSNKEMSDWKSSDIDQTIWQINLKSDVISVWDSIKVGVTRNEIEKFGKTNKGFCVKKGYAFYSCDFNNFSVAFIFQNDTLQELTVTRKCEKKKINTNKTYKQ